MVLKKSNSCLNTGLTQRFTNRGAIAPKDRPEPETVSFSLQGLVDTSPESKAIFQHALHNISEFLDLRGVDLSSFYNKDGFLDVNLMEKKFPYAKHQKLYAMPLYYKVKELIVSDVIETIVEDVQVEINVLRYLPGRLRQRKIFSWKSTDRSEKCSDTLLNRKLRRKRKLNEHSRGLQRRNKVPYRESQAKEQTDFSAPQKTIVIEIQESHAIDGRLVNKVKHSPKKETHPIISGLAHWKHKGFVNGIRSYFKGYNYDLLKTDQIEAEQDATEEDEGFYYSDIEEDCFSSYEQIELPDGEEMTHNVPSEKGRSLADYIVSPRKLKKDTFAWKPNSPSLVPTNRASSEKVERQPKGSCVFLTETHAAFNNISDVESGFESNLSDTSSEVLKIALDTEESAANPMDNDDSFDNIPLDIEADIADFILKFQQVKLSLPTDLLLSERFIGFPAVDDSEKSELEIYRVHNCSMAIANCYPPSFVLQIDSKDTECDQNWFVIGKAIDISHEQWQIQLTNLNDCHLDNEIVRRFNNAIDKQFSNEVTLQDLVQVFVDTIENELTSCSHSHSRSQTHLNTKSERQQSSSQSNESSWRRLHHLVPDQAKSMSTREALSSIPAPSNRPQTENSKANTRCPSKTEIPMYPIECDICFLSCDFCEPGESQAVALIPCGHVFCLSCWTSHVYVGLNGADAIHCMDSDCKQELDETFLRCLAPGHMVKKWHDRVEDKKIERNPLFKWCPNTACDKIGVVGEFTEKVRQFGSLVVCDCHVPWCFTCQTEPHWPASCDQMAAFRKLLAKTGNEYEVPSSRVDYAVELKRCPRCHYPIEKHLGCPSMVCRMCWFNFCWNCLRPVDHSVYACKAETNHVTFHLQNKLVHDLPFKFFPDYLEMNRKRQRVEKGNSFSWQKNLCIAKRKRLRIPFYASWRVANDDTVIDNIQTIAGSAAHLLKEIYTLLEPLYVLLCFCNMNRKKNAKHVNYALHEFLSMTDNLCFIAQRLEEKVIFRSMREILAYSNTALILIECGRKLMDNLRRVVPKLQTMTKDIDPHPVGETDPKKYLRYK